MANAVIIVGLVAAVVAAALVMRRRAVQGSACCGEHERSLVRMRVKDHDKSHYAHETTLRIGGMTCDNCAARVENALNALPGTWATVRISSHDALVRTKAEPDLDAMRTAISQAGYVLLD